MPLLHLNAWKLLPSVFASLTIGFVLTDNVSREKGEVRYCQFAAAGPTHRRASIECTLGTPTRKAVAQFPITTSLFNCCRMISLLNGKTHIAGVDTDRCIFSKPKDTLDRFDEYEV